MELIHSMSGPGSLTMRQPRDKLAVNLMPTGAGRQAAIGICIPNIFLVEGNPDRILLGPRGLDGPDPM